MKKYKIKFNFCNDMFEDLSLKPKRFLKKEHVYKYDDYACIRDLFAYIYNKIIDNYEPICDEDLRELIAVVLDDRIVNVQLDFNLKKFISLNKLNSLTLFYVIGVGSGAGIDIGIMASIRINPNESNHKYIPHVHIYKNRKNSYDFCVRINLKDFTQLNGDAKSIDKLFNKRQKLLLYKFLIKYQTELIEYYNSIQRGEYPQPIYIDYNGRKTYFK